MVLMVKPEVEEYLPPVVPVNVTAWADVRLLQKGVPEYDMVAAGKGVTVTVKDAVLEPELQPAVEISVNLAGPVKVSGGVHDAFRVLLLGEKVPLTPLSDHSIDVVPRCILPPRLDSIDPWQIVVFDLTDTH